MFVAEADAVKDDEQMFVFLKHIQSICSVCLWMILCWIIHTLIFLVLFYFISSPKISFKYL